MNTIDIQQLAARFEIREYELLEILSILLERKSIENQELVRITGLPKTNLSRVLKEISNYLQPPSPNVVINQEAVSQMSPVVKDFRDKTNDQKVLVKIKQVLIKYRSNRPTPERSLDQFTATDETTIKRAQFLNDHGDILYRNIAFIGDDDLTSVAMALFMKAVKITVFEIDKRLISLIKQISAKEKLNIETVEYDARQSLPVKYLNHYDTIFTDPPYTQNGISLFLNRSIELIKKRFQSRIYLCYGNSDRVREKELEIQQLINQKGLLVKEKINGFNKYYGAESIGSSSSLYLCDWTPKTQITKTNLISLYTNTV